MFILSMFYGITIRMCCSPKEHNLSHFHAYYQKAKGKFKLLFSENSLNLQQIIRSVNVMPMQTVIQFLKSG